MQRSVLPTKLHKLAAVWILLLSHVSQGIKQSVLSVYLLVCLFIHQSVCQHKIAKSGDLGI